MSDAAAPAFSIGKDTRCKLIIDSLQVILIRERLAMDLFLKEITLLLAIVNVISSLSLTFHFTNLLLPKKKLAEKSIFEEYRSLISNSAFLDWKILMWFSDSCEFFWSLQQSNLVRTETINRSAPVATKCPWRTRKRNHPSGKYTSTIILRSVLRL